MDAVSVADPHQRAGVDGYADVHRADHGQQHSGRHLRQSTHARAGSMRAPRPSRPATRGLRPVLMTAGAMILGMIPMALGVGEGGEQNAPLARAVIGGLLLATSATLILVPSSTLCCGGAGCQRMGACPVHRPDERSTRVPVADTEAAFDAFDEDARVSDTAAASRTAQRRSRRAWACSGFDRVCARDRKDIAHLCRAARGRVVDRVLRCKSLQTRPGSQPPRGSRAARAAAAAGTSRQGRAPRGQADVGSAGRNKRLVQLDDLCARNGLRGPVAGRHRG